MLQSLVLEVALKRVYEIILYGCSCSFRMVLADAQYTEIFFTIQQYTAENDMKTEGLLDHADQ
jgi:hypothetical protein